MPRLTGLLSKWAALAAEGDTVDGRAFADVLLLACQGLSDEALRGLPGTPDDAAAALAESPFAGRAEGAYLAWHWLESFCAELRLPVAELENGWDISDGEEVYFCPRVLLADDVDWPEDTRAFVRVDRVRRW